MRLLLISPLLLFGLLHAAPSRACGPSFPERVLLQPERFVLSAPDAMFDEELRRIAPKPDAPFSVVLPYGAEDPTRKAEAEDLKAALRKLPPKAQADALQRLQQFRAQPPLHCSPAKLSLPPEFERYARAACLVHFGDIKGAVAAFGRILALPPKARHFRTTWAHYMLAKLSSGPKARKHFRAVRRSVRKGFHDSLGLAVSSLGWEARTEGYFGQAKAIELYLEQYAHGDPSAVLSLLHTIEGLTTATDKRSVALLRAAAARPQAQAAITAYWVSRSQSMLGRSSQQTNPQLERWLQLLPKNASGADRLAWLAYRYGRFDLAQRYVDRAPKTKIGLWIRAKLLLRKGQLPQARRLLHALVEQLSQDPKTTLFARQIPAELAAIEMTQREFVQALDLLLQAGYWLDAAYVAERVLSIEELIAFVQARFPQTPPSPRSPGARLRYLLARRLVRAQRIPEALSFIPQAFKEPLSRFEAARKEQTPESLWRAAKLARHQGMELMGTEVAPDWTYFDGINELPSTWSGRSAPPKEDEPLLAPLGEERRRVRAHSPTPDLRFHYRHTASDLVLQATEAMPKSSQRAALMLCHAAGWHRRWHQERFSSLYRALVRRNYLWSWSHRFGYDCPPLDR